VRLAAHRLAPPGAGTIVRSAEQHAALERVVLSAFTTARPCDRKANRPRGAEALAAAAALLCVLHVRVEPVAGRGRRLAVVQ